MKPRIAILGSCITRDLWPIRGGGAQLLAYVSRTSLASLFTPPIEDFVPAEELPGDLHAHEHGALIADLRKTALARLIAYRPTHLIFDFIDERFDLLSIGRTRANLSGEMVRSGYMSQPPIRDALRVPRLSAGCERVWREGAGEFAAFIRATPLRDARLILHSARWATHLRDASGRRQPIHDIEVVTGQSAVIGDYNALLERQEAVFEALMPPMARVDAGPLRVADPDHRWGLSPFHYIPEYYDEVRRQLADLGLGLAFTEPPAAPSVPAASRRRAPARAISRDRRPSESLASPRPRPRRRPADSPAAD